MLPPLRHLCAIALAMLAAALPRIATADSLGPAQAREACLAEGAGSPAKLRACCDDKILEDPPAKQQRAVQECVTGVHQEKSAAEKAADAQARERRKAEQAEQAERAANPLAKASKSKGGSATAKPAVVGEPADAAASAVPAKGTTECEGPRGQEVLGKLGDLARRLGHAVPTCPRP